MPIKQHGFTMIEVLVAVLVLAVGLLGIASLQVLSLQSSSGAMYRSQATLLAYDLAERIRRNDQAAMNGQYDNLIRAVGPIQVGAPDDPACINAGCSADNLADQDAREWLEHFIDVANTGLNGNAWQSALPESTAVLARNGTDFTLTINWRETDKAQQNSGLLNRNYEMRFNL